IQTDFVYKPGDKWWLKTAGMVAILAVGVFVGTLSKGLALIFKSIKRDDNEFIQKNRIKGPGIKANKGLGENVSNLIQLLQTPRQRRNGETFFLSEVRNLKLSYEKNQLGESGLCHDMVDEDSVEQNKKILAALK